MQSEAYKITGFTAVIAAMGFLIRWLQNMQIYDANGLPDRAAHINFWVIGVIVVTAAVLLWFVIRFKRYEAPQTAETAMAGHTFVYPALGVLSAVALLGAGWSMILGADDYLYPTLRRVLGLLTIAAAFGAVMLTSGADKPERAASRRLGAVLLTLFGCFWLVVVYKENAAEPAIWRFAVEILAGCAAITAFYYVAGYQLGQPNPASAIFTCYLATFLCVMSINDDHSTADSIAYGAVALLTAMWGFTLTENLHKPQEEFKFKL